MFGQNPTHETRTIQTLHALMERLSDPNLTAAEAQALRPRLFQLLESIERDKNAIPFPAADRSVGCVAGRCAVA